MASEIDFLRLLKKDEGFLAKTGGAGGCISFERPAAVCGILGSDFSWLAMCALLLGVVRGRLLEYIESISAGRGCDAGDSLGTAFEASEVGAG